MLELNKIYCADCLELMKLLPENSVDSIVTDPPYELGFMGKFWDNTGIANNVDMWREALRVLKPGGHLLAFSGTRTYHRMASAIEDAGFEVRDMIEWVYGSGFPKSLNVAKAISAYERTGGSSPKNLRKDRQGDDYKPTGQKDYQKGRAFSNEIKDDNKKVELTDQAKQWEGWGTALKPAHEPICMARKPLDRWWKIKDDGKKIMGRVMTVAENVLKWGTGGINIDESRVDYTSEYDKKHQDDIQKGQLNADNGKFFGGSGQSISSGNLQGRFPANLIHDNSEEVRECFPESTSGARKAGFTNKETGYEASSYEMRVQWDKDVPAESGNASRFFKSIIYQAKASKSERNAGLDVIEVGNKRPQGEAFGDGSAITEHSGRKGNFHPTVKPIALMEYLIKMVTSKGGIVLDPFAGSGTTLVAAKKNGYNYIGIELTEEYIPIIEARLNATEYEKELQKEVSLF